MRFGIRILIFYIWGECGGDECWWLIKCWGAWVVIGISRRFGSVENILSLKVIRGGVISSLFLFKLSVYVVVIKCLRL